MTFQNSLFAQILHRFSPMLHGINIKYTQNQFSLRYLELRGRKDPFENDHDQASATRGFKVGELVSKDAFRPFSSMRLISALKVYHSLGCHGNGWKLKEPIHTGVISAVPHPLMVRAAALSEGVSLSDMVVYFFLLLLHSLVFAFFSGLPVCHPPLFLFHKLVLISDRLFKILFVWQILSVFFFFTPVTPLSEKVFWDDRKRLARDYQVSLVHLQHFVKWMAHKIHHETIKKNENCPNSPRSCWY